MKTGIRRNLCYLLITAILAVSMIWIPDSGETSFAAEEEKPLFTLAAISDFHTDAGIERWDVPIRTGVLDTVDAIYFNEDADVVLLGGDLTSAHMGSNWGSTDEEKKANFTKARQEIIDAAYAATDSHRALFATGNHDFAVGTLDFNSGDYIEATEKYLSPMIDATSVTDTEANAFFQHEMPAGTKEGVRHVLAYHYNIDGMDFIVINTPYIGADKHGDYNYDEESLDWVYNKLEAIGYEKTVFIIAHYPLATDKDVTSGKGVNVATQEHLKEKVLDDHPNAIYLYGHDHGGMKIQYDTFERITTYNPDGTTYVDREVAPEGFLSSFIGSMSYYGSNVTPSSLGSTTPNVVQGLMVYVYEDRIVFQMKNYGTDHLGSYVLKEYVLPRETGLVAPTPEPTQAPAATEAPIVNVTPAPQITPTPAPVDADNGTVSVTKIKKAVKKKKNKIQYSVKSVSKSLGYEIQVSNSKSFKKILLKRIVEKPKGVLSSKKLSKSKKLFIRIRVFVNTPAGKKSSDYTKPYKVK